MPPTLFQSLSSLSTSPASPLDSTADADNQEEVEANDAKDHLSQNFAMVVPGLAWRISKTIQIDEWLFKHYQD